MKVIQVKLLELAVVKNPLRVINRRLNTNKRETDDQQT